MTRLAIVVLFAGLMGPALAAGPGPGPAQEPAAAKAPAPAKASSSSKVIDDILAVSGLKESLQKLPANFLGGFLGAMQKSQSEGSGRLPPDLAQAIERSARESFTPGGFTERVTRAMKKDYNEKNYQELLADLSSPVARRMAELEANSEVTDQVLSEFHDRLQNNPLPAQRMDLIRRLNVASRTTDTLATVLVSVSKGMMRGLAGANGKCVNETQLKNAEASMEEKIRSSKASLADMATTMLAYTYRDVSDADLAEYLRIYEKENSRHIHDVIYGAIEQEFNQSGDRMGRGIMKAVKAKRASMGDHACADSGANTVAQAQPAEPEIPPGADGPAGTESPADTETGTESQAGSAVPPTTSGDQQGTAAVPKSSIPLEKRKGGDITDCLESGSKSDRDIALCAEKHRH